MVDSRPEATVDCVTGPEVKLWAAIQLVTPKPEAKGLLSAIEHYTTHFIYKFKQR